MEGLAQSMAGSAPVAAGTPTPTVEEVATMLMQGAEPEQLLAMGIPEQVIMEAIALLEQQMAAPAAPTQGQPQGLAQSMVGV